MTRPATNRVDEALEIGHADLEQFADTFGALGYWKRRPQASYLAKVMYSSLQTPLTRLERARRVAALLAAYNNGDHLAVSGQDAFQALADRDRQKG